jgi:uroporphyrinogen decarboxylase
MEHRDHDRVPRSDFYWPETIQRWQREGLDGGADQVASLLRSDVAMMGIPWLAPFPGRHEVIAETDETRDVRGPMGKVEREWKTRSGTPEHLSFDCDSREKWDRVYKPALLEHAIQCDPAAIQRRCRVARADGKFVCMTSLEGFEQIRQLTGDENTLPAMAEDPEWILDMSHTFTDLLIRNYEAAMSAGAKFDCVWVFGDLGYNHGPFFAPQAYRELIWPDHKRLCNWAHSHGMKFIYHTDGDVRMLLDDFAAAGFDALQPLEAKAGMDIRQLAPRYGRNFCFFGNINMTVAMTNDRDAVEHEVRTKLAAGMAGKGYAYHSDHSVPPGVSFETYRWIIELLDRYGNYC